MYNFEVFCQIETFVICINFANKLSVWETLFGKLKSSTIIFFNFIKLLWLMDYLDK